MRKNKAIIKCVNVVLVCISCMLIGCDGGTQSDEVTTYPAPSSTPAPISTPTITGQPENMPTTTPSTTPALPTLVPSTNIPDRFEHLGVLCLQLLFIGDVECDSPYIGFVEDLPRECLHDHWVSQFFCYFSGLLHACSHTEFHVIDTACIQQL